MSKRKAYSVKEKLEIINKVKSGVSKACIKRVYGIPEGTVRGWMTEEAKLNSFVSKLDEDSGLYRKKTRLGKYDDIDNCLYLWFVQQKNEGIPVSGTELKLQAEKIHVSMNIGGDFKASDVWLWRWQKRHGISYLSIADDTKSNDNDNEADFAEQLAERIKEEGYTESQIYNCIETALYYRMLPNNKTLNSQNLKLSKERINIVLCVNKSGKHKLKPLIIGRSQNPRCFKSLDIRTLPVEYRHSPNGCMTSKIFHNWFHSCFVPAVQSSLKEQNLEQKALLLLENYPDRPSAESLVSSDGKIKAIYLPKHASALVYSQGCRGLNKNFKINYRNEMLISFQSSKTEANEFIKDLDLKKVSYNIGSAWQEISEDDIVQFWSDYPAQDDLVSDPEISSDDEVKQEELEISLDEIKTKVEPEYDVPVENMPCDLADLPPSTIEALTAMETVIKWIKAQENVHCVKLLQLAAIKMDMLVKFSQENENGTLS